MANNNDKFKISVLVCKECGKDMYVPRRRKAMRKKNHIKTMWCPYCNKKTDFIEDGTTL